VVKLIRETDGFSIGVAGFPEGHLACQEGKHADWRHLKEKVEAGADYVLTQLFFDNADFFEFRDHLTRKLGVTVPLVPGVVPILSAPESSNLPNVVRGGASNFRMPSWRFDADSVAAASIRRKAQSPKECCAPHVWVNLMIPGALKMGTTPGTSGTVTPSCA